MQLPQRFVAMQRASLPALRRFDRSLWRPVPIVLAVAAYFALKRGEEVNFAAASRSSALVDVLHARGYAASEDDVIWINGPHGVRGAMAGGARALLRASNRNEPSDLFLVDARLSPEGALLEVGTERNITRTTGVDEGRPVLRGRLAAYPITLDGVTTGVHTIDLDGKEPATYAEFTGIQRTQVSLTNLQETGQRTGVVRNAFALDPVATDVSLSWTGDATLAIRADGREITLDVVTGTIKDGAGWVRPAPETKARPPAIVQWTVDRVRRMPWFGEENIKRLEAVAFTARGWALGARSKMVGDTSAKEVAEDLGGVNSGVSLPTFTDPEIGWPPAPMTPMLPSPLPGEGQWIALDHDPFLTQTPGAPSAFVTSFIRSDKGRPATRIYVTLWDPRQVALHMEAGTVEPVSATGEAGPGVIPRVPEVIRRLVAGFNGGFQAMHGEFGMQANGVLYLPPKPYAATVLEMRDGSTAFGSWPASADVPDSVLSYRQNLTALVENDRFNPWSRTWWGGTPQGWHDNIHTTRSGVCLTKDGFVGYFYGIDISAEVLAQGMLLARCHYGVHLDMNPGLAGFEFYNVAPQGQWTPLGRPIQADWEYEGTFKELPEFKFRARRMIKSMQHQNFPQYIHRDGRDFFYLTARPVLPGPELPTPITPRIPGEGVWRVKGLPQHGFPYAVAAAWTRPDATRPDVKVRVVRVDPRTARAAGSAGTTADTPTIVSFAAPHPKPQDLSVWLGNSAFIIGNTAPAPDAVAIAAGGPLPALSPQAAAKTRVAVGVHDEDGMLEWVELASETVADEKTAQVMDHLLEKAGCSTRILVQGDARTLLGGSLDAAGEPTRVPAGPVVRLVRGNPPGARAIFADTPIVPYSLWQTVQNQRVRYFRKPSKSGADAGAPAPDAGGSPTTPAPAGSAPTVRPAGTAALTATPPSSPPR